jgi:hypothetical protein
MCRTAVNVWSDSCGCAVLARFEGPVIEEVFITDAPDYNLFAPKPDTDGPTPLVNSLTIRFTDLPERVAPDFLFDALKQDVAEHPGHYLLVGDHNGVIPIVDVIVTQDLCAVCAVSAGGSEGCAAAVSSSGARMRTARSGRQPRSTSSIRRSMRPSGR